jgi:basic amino acid/polyamine antiporter, APA family
MIDSKVGKYTLTAKWGGGYYGSVYAASEESHPELKVAIKVLHPSLTMDSNFLSAIRETCKTLLDLQHPNIVEFIDLIEQKGNVAQVFEHLNGEDAQLRLSKGPIALDEVRTLGESALEGLAFAHSKGILHCNIKPSNILICDKGYVKLMDFCLVEAVEQGLHAQRSAIHGSLTHMPPERFRGEKATPSSDIYSLGLTLWEILAGKSACPKGNLASMMNWHLEQGPEDIRNLRSDLPDGLCDVVMQMCIKDPKRRPDDAVSALELWRECSNDLQPSPVTSDPAIPKAEETKIANAPEPLPRKVTKELDRNLGFWSVFSIAVGAMMGSGIFVLPGIAASIAGPWVAASYMLAGILVLPAVFSKAELATAMPVAGGTYVYVDRAMGPWMGTITGLGTWFSLSSKTAFALVGLGAYLVLFTDLPVYPFTIFILVAMLSLNILGANKATGLQMGIVLLCLVALAVFVGLGLWKLDPSLLTPAFPNGFSTRLPSGESMGILAGAGFVFVSYSGVTKVCSIAEEIRDPARNIPLGMVSAQVAVMVLYGLVSIVITGNKDYKTFSAEDKTPIADLGGILAGELGLKVMAVVAVLGLMSMCNAGVLSTSRFPFAMSRAKALPEGLQMLSEKFGTPTRSILLTGVLLFCLITFLPIVKLAKLASGFKIFIFCVVNLAVIVLRETNARWYHPTFQSPFYPWTQILGIVGGIWLLYNLGTIAIYGVALSLAVGTAWYFAYAKKRIQRKSVLSLLWGESRALRATEEAENDEEDASLQAPRVLVPVFGEEPAPERLIRLAAAFVEDGQLEVTRLEEVPDQANLTDFMEADQKTQHLADNSYLVGEDTHINVDFHSILTHNAMETVISHASKTKAEWIVMEWPKRRKLQYIVKHPLSWWLDHPPCDLAIFRDKRGVFDGDTSDDFSRILVIAKPGPYDSLLVHVADRLAQQQKNGVVTLLYPVKEDCSEERLQQHKIYHQQLGKQIAGEWNSIVHPGKDLLSSIRDISADYDLLLLGAPSEQPLRTLFFGSMEHKIADNAKCSILKVKAPRHRVHHRMNFIQDKASIETLKELITNSMTDGNLSIARKTDLFAHIAAQIASKCGSTDKAILAALDRRELHQNTAIEEGIAMTAPVVPGAERTVLGFYVLAKNLDYRSTSGATVRVVAAVIAPPEERQMQLFLIQKLSKIMKNKDVLTNLKKASSSEVKQLLLEQVSTIKAS